MTTANWAIFAISAHLFYLFLVMWMRRATTLSRELMWCVMVAMSILSKLLCNPAERPLAIFVCLLPARLLLCLHERSRGALRHATLSLSAEYNFILGLITRLSLGRLFRTYFANHYYHHQFTPLRTKLLSRDQLLALFIFVDSTGAAYLRLADVQKRGTNAHGLGIDLGVAAAMPLASCALLMTRYSEWWEANGSGGRYAGDLPYWLSLISILMIECEGLVPSVQLILSECKAMRRANHPGGDSSNAPTSLEDFLAASQLPPKLDSNPVFNCQHQAMPSIKQLPTPGNAQHQ